MSPPWQVTFELSKREDWHVPIWVIVGSTLGGLLLLALLVLALWKVRGAADPSFLLCSPLLLHPLPPPPHPTPTRLRAALVLSPE